MAEVITGESEYADPQSSTDQIEQHKYFELRLNDTGKYRSEGPDDGKKSAEDKGLAAMPGIKHPCHFHIFLLKKEGFPALEYGHSGAQPEDISEE
jgi:hypothetical protein